MIRNSVKKIFNKNLFFQFLKSRKGKIITVIIILFTWFWFSLPEPLFKNPTSTVLIDKDGILLGAKISGDKQWRFPQTENVPDKFKKAIVEFEDRNFYYHPGINPFSLVRALVQNIKKKKIVSGGSTISMQVIRLSRKGKSRTVFEKFIEIILALRLELTHSKSEILSLYSSNAPFGGNVVGIEAASWRYFGRPPEKLSWAEMSTLAVLPNSPSLIFPGKNHEKLKAKRNRLLDRLHEKKYIDDAEWKASENESLLGKPFPLPRLASHLLDRATKEGHKGEIVKSTIDVYLQEKVNEVIEKHHKLLKANDINNAAVIVLDVCSGNVLAYVGNTNDKDPQNGSFVDIINAPRSTGSILKPFLYAAMLHEGQLIPNMLIADVPTQINGYAPENYSQSFDGAIPAKRALARSLNVPAVRLLQSFGLEKFNYFLKKTGLTTLNKPASYYGLTIILGGAEGKLWDLAGAYASMARTLNNYFRYNDKYLKKDFHPPVYIAVPEENKGEINFLSEKFDETSFLDAASIWLTFEAMVEVSRPDDEYFWQQFSTSAKIAWKTGTSYGYRDGWAIGCNPKYVVAVWVGNADGEGRPDLMGISTAAPILFDIFKILKPSGWFRKPYDDMIKIPVCHLSGFKSSQICESVDTMWVQKSGEKTQICPYHQLVHLDPTEKWLVNSDCEQVSNMKTKSWFVLPPVIEWYFKSKNPFYKSLPQWRPDCKGTSNDFKSMDVIYPKALSKLYIPIEFSGKEGKIIFKVAHRNPDATIYWHIDEKYVGSTTNFHQMGLAPDVGKHILTLVDQSGETLIERFEIIGKRK